MSNFKGCQERARPSTFLVKVPEMLSESDKGAHGNGRAACNAALPLPCADALAQDLAGKPLLSLGMHQSSDAPKPLLNQEVAGGCANTQRSDVFNFCHPLKCKLLRRFTSCKKTPCSIQIGLVKGTCRSGSLAHNPLLL